MVHRFSRRKKEEDNINLEANDVKLSKDECARSLLGRILGEKVAIFTGISNTFSQLWCPQGSLRVVELGLNFFQFGGERQSYAEEALVF